MRKIILIFGVLLCNLIFGQKIEVLNLATFHMQYTPDANKVEFDQYDKKNKLETLEIAKKLAKFKPTVILVEVVPSKNEELQSDYQNFLKNEDYKTKFGGEIALIAYEIGKIAGVKKIYGIDEQETASYNYNIGNELKNQVDSLTSKNYIKGVMKKFKELEKKSTFEKLKFYNTKEGLDIFLNANADILTYNSTKGNFEGADEASKFYRRNLRIYSNINQIPLNVNDRVFIIMGASHSAFLDNFMKRSPKYKIVNTLDFLK
ncbi:DUF5694 domain-containing protein [Vaginella massiliensis]|uniref:DUF5694 domain-containing protein n=1 Tax=Vaginella massiliensis TaxID=1816680 RepID=UPI0037512540